MTMRLLPLLAFFLGISAVAPGYPNMVRHGYASCTACHVSPNGGGVITGYGRTISGELLNAWGNSGKESAWLYGVVDPPEWLTPGGDVRWIQTMRNDATRTSYRFIVMQADLEAAATAGEFTAVGTIGYHDVPGGGSTGDHFISRRHYLMYRPEGEKRLAVRAGRFMQAFGINTDDHVIETKRGLGFDEGSESYNVEASWTEKKWEAFVTGNFGRPDDSSLQRENGFALRPAMMLTRTVKLGGSYFHGFNPNFSRHLFGPWAIVGLTEHLYVLAELDFQSLNVKATGASRFGFVNYLRLGYEFTRGFHAFATQEYSKLDLKNPATDRQSYGVGLQAFPRPHFELQAFYQKTRALSASMDFADFAWFLFHFYL